MTPLLRAPVSYLHGGGGLKYWTHRPSEGLTHCLAYGRVPDAWLLLHKTGLYCMRLLLSKVKNDGIWVVSEGSWQTGEAQWAHPALFHGVSLYVCDAPISFEGAGIIERFLFRPHRVIQRKFCKGRLTAAFSLASQGVINHKSPYGTVWTPVTCWCMKRQTEGRGLTRLGLALLFFLCEQKEAQVGNWKNLWAGPGFWRMLSA